MSEIPFKDALSLYADGSFTKMVEKHMANGVPFVAAAVIAGDELHGQTLEQHVKKHKCDPMKFVLKVGSYARFDWARRNLTNKQFFKNLPELWRGADPDDTRDYALPIWEEASRRNKGKIIVDEKPLRKGNSFTVYRGQIGDAPGIAWSLSVKIAMKFALTGGMRMIMPGGKLIKGRVARADILAYISGRGEKEIIVDPFKIKILEEVLCKN